MEKEILLYPAKRLSVVTKLDIRVILSILGNGISLCKMLDAPFVLCVCSSNTLSLSFLPHAPQSLSIADNLFSDLDWRLLRKKFLVSSSASVHSDI